MKTLKEIRQMVSEAYTSPTCENICHILNILDALVANLQRQEQANKRAVDTASCLANGIKPD